MTVEDPRDWGRRFDLPHELRSLGLIGNSINSLEHVSTAPRLTSLACVATGIEDLSPIAALPLSSLRLDRNHRVDGFQAIASLEALQELRLGNEWGRQSPHLDSLERLGNLSQLRVLELNLPVRSEDLSAVLEMKNLRQLRLPAEFARQVDELRSNLPRTAVSFFGTSGDSQARSVAGIGIGQRGQEGAWSIFERLPENAAYDSAFAWESYIRGAVRDQDPELLERLDFDSEPEALGVVAQSRQDLETVAEIAASYPWPGDD